MRARAEALRADLDPVRLLADSRNAQHALVTIADQIAVSPPMVPVTGIPVADFLMGLRTAWQLGEVRPTARPKAKPKRGRRRPDPLVAVTGELRDWFAADPSQTGAELLARLQASYPETYQDGLLRTIQRRLRVWRSEIASQLVFGLVSQDLQHQLREHRREATEHSLGNILQ